MPRPRIPRRIWYEPSTTYFKPVGIPISELEEVVLTLEEFEAIRVVDIEGVDQTDAAKKMNVSQPTFSRMLDSAHKKMADALVNGKAIRVTGGTYSFVPRRGRRFGRRLR